MIKAFIVIIMIAILGALGSSLFFLVRDRSDTKRTVKGLSWRISLSLGLFFFLFLAYSFGWIAPHSL